MKLITKLKKAIQEGSEAFDVNLINCGEYGKEIDRLLKEAGYEPDNLGPQRLYIK